MEYNTQVGIFETGEKDSQGGAYKDNRFLALRKRELNEYEVKDGVAIIGDRAFYDAKLRSVTLPNSLRSIGESAFAGCKNLTDIALPEGLEVIKDTAFRDCESLAELTLPSTLLEVGARAFGPGLKRLVILSENVTFSPDAFKQAKSLEEILVPEAVIGKYTVLFLAMGITVPLTEIKAEQEQEVEAIVEESTGNTTAATNKIDECANKIKGHLHELGMNEFVLYTCDYCGDLEWNEDFESLDSAVSLNLYFDLHENFNGEERTFIAPRKIKIKGDDLLIDLQEVKEYNEGEEEVLGYYESQSVDALLERFETSDIEKCFTEILAHTFNSDIISLNQQEEEETIDEEQESERTIRVDLTRSGIKRITMLPLDNEGMEIMKKHGNNAEEACSDIYDKLWSEDSGQLMDFVFENAYSEYGLCVVDPETEEVFYEDDSFVPDTSCGLMSYSEAEAEYPDNEDDFSSYAKYLRSECQTNELYLSQGFAKAWNELSEPTTESAATFIPNFMHYALSAADAKNALLMGVEESEVVTVSFYINLPEGENFDPAKLDFINIDAHYDDYSEVLQELLARDLILLNAIIYDGKIYFAGHDDIDILGDSDEEPIFDYVDENIAKKKMNFYEFITNVRMSYDYYDEQEYDEDDENYLSAQLAFSELADDEIDRFFDILGDECDFPNEALWTMVDYDGELERDSLIDIDDENAGMEILMQYPEAFVKAAHKFLAEQEGEECEEAIYGVGGYFWWGDDELEEEFFVEDITM